MAIKTIPTEWVIEVYISFSRTDLEEKLLNDCYP
jgi:hypothetical protein